MAAHSIDWEAIDWTPVREGVERKAFSGGGATLALHRLWPGHEIKPHSHRHEQIVYILAGTVDFDIGDEVVRLGPGGLAVVPPRRRPLRRDRRRRAGAEPRRVHAGAPRVRLTPPGADSK